MGPDKSVGFQWPYPDPIFEFKISFLCSLWEIAVFDQVSEHTYSGFPLSSVNFVKVWFNLLLDYVFLKLMENEEVCSECRGSVEQFQVQTRPMSVMPEDLK